MYLGGLGGEHGDLSPHLRSRAETARVLESGPVPVTTLGAAMIVGKGSAAFETILALGDTVAGDDLPAVGVRRDAARRARRRRARALVAVAGRKAAFGESYDVGGPEVMTYRAMMERTARLRGRHPFLIEVPFLTPRLSSLWLHLVTPGERGASRDPSSRGSEDPHRRAATSASGSSCQGAEPSFDEAVKQALRGRSV